MKKVSALQKIINFRSIFFLFLLSMVCIFLGFKITTNLFYLFLLIIPISFFIFLVIKKRFILLTISIVLLSFLSLYTYFFVSNYSDKTIVNQECYVSGRVLDIYKVNENFSYYTLENVTLKLENGKEKSIKGNISIGVNNYDNILCDVGYYLSSNIELSCVLLVNDNGSINSIYLKNNIRYEATKSINLKNSIITSGNKYLNEIIKEYNQNLLVGRLGEDDGNLALAVLYGDRDNVNQDLLNIFKYSGVMHIFAVSGLHIGLIVSLLIFSLNKLKINQKWQFIISAIILFAFCYLCSFSAPVVRATIMALTILFAKLLERKNDSLNTVSLSGLIILTLNPLNFFDGGFQMTFVAVFGIILFSNLFKKVKINNTIFKKIFLLIATSLSTQLALLPILANFYGYYTTWSLLANLFTLPIFSVFYTLLFVINLVVLVLPFMDFLLLLPKALLNMIVYINLLITKLPYGIIKTYKWNNLATITYFLFLFSLSRFLILEVKLKIVTSILLFIISFAFMLFSTMPFRSSTNSLYFKDYYQTGYTSLLTTKNNKVYLINPNFSSQGIRKLKTAMELQKINKIDGILLGFEQEFEAKDVKLFLNNFDTTLYLPENHQSINNLESMGVIVKKISDNTSFLLNDIKITYLLYENQFYGCLIDIENKKTLEINAENIALNQNFIQYINSDLNFSYNCVRIYNAEGNDFNNIFNSNSIIFSSVN